MKKWKLNGQGQILTIGFLLILVYKIINNFESIWQLFLKVLSTMSPFFTGIVIAFFLYRPVKKLAKVLNRCKLKPVKRFSMAISTLFVYFVIFFALSITVKYFVPILYKNIEDFINQVPKYYTVVEQFLEQNKWFDSINLDHFVKENILPKLNLNTLNQYLGLVSKIANSFLSAFMSIIFSIYIILEKDAIFLFIKRVFTLQEHGNATWAIMYFLTKTVELFYSYFSGLFFDALIMGSASFILLSCFKVPFAPLLGVITGVGNLIPFFGPIVSTIVISLVSLLTVGPLRLLWILITMVILSQLDSNVVQPKILSHSVGVSPLLVLLSVSVFGGLFGATGMIIGVPLVAAIKFVISDYLDDRKINGSTEKKESEATEKTQ